MIYIVISVVVILVSVCAYRYYLISKFETKVKLHLLNANAAYVFNFEIMRDYYNFKVSAEYTAEMLVKHYEFAVRLTTR